MNANYYSTEGFYCIIRLLWNEYARMIFSRYAKAGFTLLELMVVVAVIAILVRLATTQYEQSQRKARRAEAKLALAAIYNLEKSFYSEYSAYIPAFDSIGYTPEGFRRFYLNEACPDTTTTWPGSVTGFTGAHAVASFSTANMPWPENYSLEPSHSCVFGPDCAGTASNPQTLEVWVEGNLCATCYTDMWTIDHNRRIRTCASGLR